jgi:hypothetical protein
VTGPNPDAELDAALGLDQLPPARFTHDHLLIAAELTHAWEESELGIGNLRDRIAQAIADAEARGSARVIAEREKAGVRLDGRLLAAREDYAELTRAAEYHLDRCAEARADQTATGLPFAVGEARRRLAR